MAKTKSAPQVHFEDVSVGMELPTIVKHPNELQLFMFAAATWDTHRTHWDIPYAVNVEKLPGILVFGHMQAAFLGQLVTDWITPGGRLLRLNYQNRRMAIQGDTLSCKGKIKEKKEENGKGLIVAETWIENQKGEITTTAESTFELPKRK